MRIFSVQDETRGEITVQQIGCTFFPKDEPVTTIEVRLVETRFTWPADAKEPTIYEKGYIEAPFDVLIAAEDGYQAAARVEPNGEMIASTGFIAATRRTEKGHYEISLWDPVTPRIVFVQVRA